MEEQVREILKSHFGNSVFTVEDDVVWVSGMNSRCEDLAKNMIRKIQKEGGINCTSVYDDGVHAMHNGGIEFKYGSPLTRC